MQISNADFVSNNAGFVCRTYQIRDIMLYAGLLRTINTSVCIIRVSISEPKKISDLFLSPIKICSKLKLYMREIGMYAYHMEIGAQKPSYWAFDPGLLSCILVLLGS